MLWPPTPISYCHAAAPRFHRLTQPIQIAGTGRLCTDISRASAGHIVAKVGADGIYCAALPAAGLGLALKVQSGDFKAASPALLHVLAQLPTLLERRLPQPLLRLLDAPLCRDHAGGPIRNTRDCQTGGALSA